MRQGEKPCFVAKTCLYDAEMAAEVDTFRVANKSVRLESALVETPVRVISYMGSASDKIGNEGDFYVDEMTNVLYGPKSGGAWPEDGVDISGPILCKRTFIQLNNARMAAKANRGGSSKPKGGWLRAIYCFLRFRLTVRSREIISLRVDGDFSDPTLVPANRR